MVVLVLGGYGLIGSAILCRLADAGHEVIGLGKNSAVAARRFPDARWIDADIAALRRPSDWHSLLRGIDAVVNAAGALQDGVRDNVAALQSHAMRALFQACIELGIRRVVQISATGATPAASTSFMRSKAEADAALAALDLDWVILRPGLVLSRDAYGATGLLRALASFPFVLPVLNGKQAVRTVAVEDVAEAALLSVEGRIPAQRRYDLVEAAPHRLRDLVASLRAWLGFAPVPAIEVPSPFGWLVAGVADLLGWLGWRSPIRSTSLRELAGGIDGDPALWNSVGAPVRDLDATLRAMPATLQERWFARLWLLKPLLCATVACFWIASGAVGLWRRDAAASLLTGRGMDLSLAEAAATGGALLDMLLGLALLVRRTHVTAAVGMLLLSFLYLVGGSLLAPDLWLDPLGPYLKIVPSMGLLLVVLALSPER